MSFVSIAFEGVERAVSKLPYNSSMGYNIIKFKGTMPIGPN